MAGVIKAFIRATRIALTGAESDYVPLQQTANGELRVRDDDAVGGVHSSGVSDTADEVLGDGTWADVDLPDKTSYVLFSSDYAVYAKPGAGSAPTHGGPTFFPGIVYRLECHEPSFEKLWLKRLGGSSTTVKLTFFTHP